MGIQMEQRRMPVDKEKLDKILFEKKLVKKQLSLEMAGYRQYLNNEITRGLRHQTIVMLDKLYGIAYDEIKPDEPKKEKAAETGGAEADAEEEKPEEEKKQTETQAPAAQADLSKLEDMLQRAVRLLNQNAEFEEMVKQGFRVRTTPQIMTQDISEGVRQGMEAFWRNQQKDIIGKLNGLVYAATLQAIKNAYEMAQKEGAK